MHAEGGVFEEAAPPPEDEMRGRGEQDNIGERDRLRERRHPVVEAFTSCLTRQLLPLRRQPLPKQPVSIDLIDGAFDGEAPAHDRWRDAHGHGSEFPEHVNPNDDISA